MLKLGAKRAALSDSDPNSNDFTLKNKRVMDEPESSRPNLDLKRGESARQHVRALNNQFASWVQLQLQNHPDELWEDGVKDYLSHASHILDKFKDVVEWLRAEAAKSENTTAAPLFSTHNKSTPVFGISKPNSKPEVNNGFVQETKSSTFSNLPGSGLFSMNQPSASSSLLQNSTQSSSQNSNFFSTSQKPTNSSLQTSSSSLQNLSLSSSSSSGLFSFSQSQTSSSLQSSSFSSSQSTGLFNVGQTQVNSNLQSSGLSSSQSSGLFTFTPKPAESSSSMQSSGFSSSQSSGFFAMNQTPVFDGAQSFAAAKVEALKEDTDEENEMEQPSSPSLKKTEEKGVVVVHEVKCKVYVKTDNPEDKAWKDMGMGQLSIKCKEGASKAAKESKPTIIIRNDVGRILLNALIYPGIKMNVKKNTIASIFHTSGSGQNDGDESEKNSVVARTYLLRLKTEEDATKLAATIQDYAPSA